MFTPGSKPTFGPAQKSLPPEKVREIMQEEMAVLIQKVIDASPPNRQGGLTAGKKRIQEEINRVFKPIRSEWFSDVVAQKQWEPISAYKFVFRSKRLEDAFNRQQLDALDKAFNPGPKDSNVTINWGGMEPRRELHKQQRGPDGRIVSDNLVYYVGDKKGIVKYAEIVAKSVGKMVAGWYQVMNGLGKSVKSPYTAKGKGSVEFTASPEKYTLTAKNELGNFNEMLPKFVNPQELINQAAANCQRRVDAILKTGQDPAKGKMGAPSKPMANPAKPPTARTAGTPKQQAAAHRRVVAVTKMITTAYAQQGVTLASYSCVSRVGNVLATPGNLVEAGKNLVEYERGVEALSKLKGPELIGAAMGKEVGVGASIESQLAKANEREAMLEGWKDD